MGLGSSDTALNEFGLSPDEPGVEKEILLESVLVIDDGNGSYP